ncbi:disks large-associated protein 5-like isoform X2 [Oratosquilla oratoria]|uniref:disks large-associated protein 5-like isoform X2 n=1 Tax=Oratosquilla oratoria TaxID=337810 RepID=UPI003F7664C2
MEYAVNVWKSAIMFGVPYFRQLIRDQKTHLQNLCDKWLAILEDESDVPEDAQGDIRTAAGQANLLMKERFTQFSGLIDNCEFKQGEKETTVQDLQGFWDIVYIQVEDVNKKFSNLEKLKDGNWKVPSPEAPACAPKKLVKKVFKPKVGGNATSAVRAHILAARQKMKNANGNVQITTENNVKRSPEKRKTSDHLAVTGEDKENKATKLMKSLTLEKDAGFSKIPSPNKQNNPGPKKEVLKSPVGSQQMFLSSTVLKKRLQESPPVHKDYSPCIRITRSMKMTRDLNSCKAALVLD